MAFGGDKEKRVLCPAGHSVREDRLPYHMVKHLCAPSVASHNPDRRVMYNADKKGRKMQRMADARNFKAALGIPQEGTFKEEDPSLVASAGHPVRPPSPDQPPAQIPDRPPSANHPGQASSGGTAFGGGAQGSACGGGGGGGGGAAGAKAHADDDDDDEWGAPLFPANR